MAHSRITPEGQLFGRFTAQLAARGRQRLQAQGLTHLGLAGLRDDMCKSCACRPATVPNGCPQTQMDLLKAASEGVPFLCHAPRDGRMCAGWAAVRAALVEKPLSQEMQDHLAAHTFAPPDKEG